MHQKGRIVAVCLTVAVAISIAQTISGSKDWQSRSTWAEYGGGPDGSHYSALTQIDRRNVDQLQVAWSYPAEGGGEYSPLVAGKLAYVLAKGGSIVALDAATGKEVWAHSFRASTGAAPNQGGRGGGGVNQRGLNYWESKDHADKRILCEAGGYLWAIDAATGESVQSFGDGGKVDLKTGIDVNHGQPLTTRTGGRIFEDLFIVGSATGEGYLSPSGDLRAFNVVTGKLAWVFHTIPRPGEPNYETFPPDAWKYLGGNNTWGEITVDEETGIGYFPTGSPTYDFYGTDRKGDGLYGDCLLALDARTGKYKWHFQLVHHDLWDYDAVTAPQLITIKHDGKTVKAVAQAGKQGFLYVFDRVTGKPIWPIEERPVPKSNMPGEYASPTQPFPTAPPPFARQSFTANDIDTFFLTPEERSYWKDRVSKSENEGLYTPPAYNKDTVYMPGHNGGANFFGAASVPEKGLVYVVTKNVPGLINVGELGHPNPVGADGASHVGHGGAPGRGPAAAGGGRALTPVAMGRSVFAQNCQGCHGADMKGTNSAPSLDGVLSRRGRDGVMTILRDGIEPMPAFSSLSTAEVNGILALLGDPIAAGSDGGTRSNEQAYPEGIPQYRRFYNNAPIGGLYPTIISPPWSTMTAYDLNTGKIIWQIPYGDADNYEPNPTGELRGNIFQKTGPAITASGLIFYAGNEARVRVVNSDTGKEIRKPLDLPRGSQGVPAVYEVDGREFILFNATGAVAGVVMTPAPIKPDNGQGAYVAFAMPKKTP